MSSYILHNLLHNHWYAPKTSLAIGFSPHQTQTSASDIKPYMALLHITFECSSFSTPRGVSSGLLFRVSKMWGKTFSVLAAKHRNLWGCASISSFKVQLKTFLLKHKKKTFGGLKKQNKNMFLFALVQKRSFFLYKATLKLWKVHFCSVFNSVCNRQMEVYLLISCVYISEPYLIWQCLEQCSEQKYVCIYVCVL